MLLRHWCSHSLSVCGCSCMCELLVVSNNTHTHVYHTFSLWILANTFLFRSRWFFNLTAFRWNFSQNENDTHTHTRLSSEDKCKQQGLVPSKLIGLFVVCKTSLKQMFDQPAAFLLLSHYVCLPQNIPKRTSINSLMFNQIWTHFWSFVGCRNCLVMQNLRFQSLTITMIAQINGNRI